VGTKGSAKHARQSRTHARSAIKTSVLLLAIATLSIVLDWDVRWSLWPAGIFATIACIELVNARWHERRLAGDKKPRSAMKQLILRPPPGEFGEFSLDGEYTGYGTSVEAGGQVVIVEVLLDKRSAERRQAALGIVADAARLFADFAAFKEAEAGKRQDVASEVRSLELELIAFVAATDASLAEVSFTAASGGDEWSCAFKNGAFFDLSSET
jgi:hypothetical protein